MHDVLQKTAEDLKTQQQHNVDEIKRLSDAVAADKAALAAGNKILTPEQRSAIVESAKSDRQAAKDEAGERRKEALGIEDDLKRARDDIIEKQKAIDHPPSELSTDDKAAYLADRKTELEQAKQSLVDAQNRQGEANKAAADADARAATMQKAIEHPEVPLTDDDKTAAKASAQETLDRDTAELESTKAATDLLKESVAENDKQAADGKNLANAANVVLMQKHRGEFETLFKQK